MATLTTQWYTFYKCNHYELNYTARIRYNKQVIEGGGDREAKPPSSFQI